MEFSVPPNDCNTLIRTSAILERACGNIRNDIAHGLLDENDIEGSVYSYFFGALIKLILYTSKGAFAIIKHSNKLKHILKGNN